jgi:UPF0716 protein FxsA
MAGLLFLLIIVVPVAELYIIVQFAQEIGVLETFGLLILISIAGAFLLKQQGLATWQRMQATLARGEMPGKEVTDAFLVLIGGALLLTPGFLTDAVGILLLLPPTRAALKGVFRRMLGSWAIRRAGPAGKIYTATVVRNERGARTSPGRDEPPANAPRLDAPREPAPGSSGDSPDRG